MRLASENQKNSWTVEDSKKLYQIDGWGEPYFSINDSGNVTVSSHGMMENSLDLLELVESLSEQNIQPPLLIHSFLRYSC